MTIQDMVQAGVYFWRRADWEPGQFVHATALFANRAGAPGGVEVCCCRAPILATEEPITDDLWLRYEGEEAENVEYVDVSIPTGEGLLGLLAAALAVRKHLAEEEVKEALPAVKPWQVTPPMHG